MRSAWRLVSIALAAGVMMVGLSRGQQAETTPEPGGPHGGLQLVPGEGQRIEAVPLVKLPSGPKSRYRGLLTRLDVPADQAAYGDFCDFGFWSGTEYAGHANLPAGYWVYVAPTWYIFKEDVSSSASVAGQAPRAWGPEQAAGAPDTWPRSGDIGTAWASRTPDGQPEWLELTYDFAVRPSAILVYETYNPGALTRLTAYDATGKEVELWSGSDPTPIGKETGISVVPVQPEFDLTRIRLYFDSPKVPGWNEIDAVGLLDDKGVMHWATSATASSTYAELPRQQIQIYQDVPPAGRAGGEVVPEDRLRAR